MSRALQEPADILRNQGSVPVPAPEHEESGGPILFPLSFGQQRLWFLDELDPGSSAYNSSGAIRLRGRLDIVALQRALNEIVARHEVLRTTFSVENGTLMQVVHSAGPLPLVTVDYGGLPADRREEALKAIVWTSPERPFSLATGPLLRGTLVRMAEEDHVLLLTIHHIIYDGWSAGVFTRELSLLYESFSAGRPSPLAELPIQYGDFAEWQREYLKGHVLEELLACWRSRLAGAPPLELRTDRPRPAAQTFRGAEIYFSLDRKLSNELARISRQEGATLFITLLAAFNVLLARYSGQEDICVGTPIANRTHVETEQLIGFFVNTLVIRSDLRGNPSFRALVQRVRSVAFEAYAHQDLPFEKIVEELQPKRDLSRSALFQVMFVLQNAPAGEMRLPALTLAPVEFGRHIAKFDLTITMAEGNGGLAGIIEYNCDLFDRATMERLSGHWEQLLRSIAADPCRSIAELELLTEPERHALKLWNRTAASYPREETIAQLFEQQVASCPEHVALRQDGDQISFAELNRRANRIAHWLSKHGAGPESLVGLSLERSIDAVVALLAILKTGAAYVPLDPDYPRERVRFMLEDSAVRLLVTRQKFKNQLLREGTIALCLDSDLHEIEDEPDQNLPLSATLESLAYVLYTSGSTGRPKGVLAPHVGTINRFWWMWTQFPFQPGEVCCQKTSLNFVDSVWEIFGPLLKGVPSIVIPNQIVKEPRQLIDVLARNKVTRMVLVPSLLRLLVDAYNRSPATRRPNLWIVSGEALSTELAAQFREVLPDATLLNLYGSSEVAADATWYSVTGNESGSAGIPIGRPISNVQVRILDRFNRQVPVGIPGEIHVGGEALARGYLNQPQMTADKFIPDPFIGSCGARLYKTGDLGRYRSDGVIEYLGRLDHQIKIRGHRIELGEIESVMREYDGVKDCVVVARGETAADKRIIAHVAADCETVHADGLRQFVASRLPELMLPTAIVVLAALPLTPNGKVDRLALPEREQQCTVLVNDHVSPRDPLELQVARLWEKVLRTQPIGIYDNFFELGGHSFLAVDLFSELEKSFGKVLPLATLFRAPTVAQLTDVIRHEGWESAWASLVPLQPEGSALPFFCVHSLGTNLVSYGHLARSIGNDQPFYGLQPVGLDGREEPHDRVEEMAAHYLSQIRRLQTHGPYHIGGVCLGGVVAFEMAQQLRRAGEQVGLLALIDSQFPGFPKHLPNYPLRPSLVSLVDYYVGDVLMRPLDGKIRYIATRVRNVGARTWNMWRRMLSGPEVETVVASTIQKVKKANSRAGGSYRPQPYNGKVTLFWCSEVASRSYQDRRLGWCEVAGAGLEVHVIPGNHMTMVDHPHVLVMAEKLRACLQKTNAASSAAGGTRAVAAH